MVEVFKTNVDEAQQAIRLAEILSSQFPLFRINFDIEDCDRILRVEGHRVLPEQIIAVMDVNGYHCMVLE